MTFKKRCRIIALIILIIAILFFVSAITHTTASFPLGDIINYLIYAGYVVIVYIIL